MIHPLLVRIVVVKKIGETTTGGVSKVQGDRIWPVNITTADELQEKAGKRGVDRTLWIRALLNLAANGVEVPHADNKEDEIRAIVDGIVRAVIANTPQANG
jgi:hypothetical protein